MSSNNQKRLKEKDLREMAIKAFKPHFEDLLRMDKTAHLIAIDEKLREFAKANVKGISSSQLRRLYDEILTKKTAREIQLLRPIFAYTIARQNNNQAKQVMLLIDTLAKELSEEEEIIAGFKRFMEALVAYHKYYEVTKSQIMKLLGKIILKGALTTRTGLHIGGSKSSLSIGGIDNNIIKTADGRPYIPGSSLKGKLRSLLAKKEGSLFFQEQDRQEEIKMIEQKKKENPASAATLDAYLTRISAAKTDEAAGVEYLLDLFGHSADSKDENVIRYSRLIVRDALLLNGSSEIFADGFTHAKWENVINRRTGTAEHPRQMERVPVGAKFDLELIYNLYDDVLNPQDKLFSHLQHIVFSLKLLEDDFIGGSGSRGYGQVDVEIDLDATCLKQIRGTKYEEGGWLLLNEKVDALESFQKALQNFQL